MARPGCGPADRGAARPLRGAARRRPGHNPRSGRQHRAVHPGGRHEGLEPDAAGAAAAAGGVRAAAGRLHRPSTDGRERRRTKRASRAGPLAATLYAGDLDGITGRSLSADCPSRVRWASSAYLFPGGGSAIGHGGDMAQDTATDFDFAAWVRESRAAQGLPETVEDMDTLNRAARLLLLRLRLSNGSARGSGRNGTSRATAGTSGQAGPRPSRLQDGSGRA